MQTSNEDIFGGQFFSEVTHRTTCRNADINYAFIYRAEIVGLAAIYIIKHAESASAWLIECNKLHKLDQPRLEEISTFIEDYSQGASQV